MKDWHIATFQIKDLREYPDNPRSISKEDFSKLVQNIEKFGLIDLPITDGNSMLIGGHQRIKAMKKLKHKEVQCWVPNEALTQEEAAELCIRLNKNGGKFDFDVLANCWDVNSLVDWGFRLEEFDIDIDVVDESEEKESTKKNEKSCPSCGAKL